jgi:hypothetical protein
MKFLALPAGSDAAAGVALVVGLYLLRPLPPARHRRSDLAARAQRAQAQTGTTALMNISAAGTYAALSIAAALTRPEIAAVGGRAEKS